MAGAARAGAARLRVVARRAVGAALRSKRCSRSSRSSIVLGLAGRFGRRWWLVGAPSSSSSRSASRSSSATSPQSGTHDPSPTLRADARELERRERVRRAHRCASRRCSDVTNQANAYSPGFGPVDERRPLGHAARRPLHARRGAGRRRARARARQRRHMLEGRSRGTRCFASRSRCSSPSSTRRRGGIANPATIPLALLVARRAQLVAAPIENAVSRRYEAEADWAALQATRDPASARRAVPQLRSARASSSRTRRRGPTSGSRTTRRSRSASRWSRRGRASALLVARRCLRQVPDALASSSTSTTSRSSRRAAPS